MKASMVFRLNSKACVFSMQAFLFFFFITPLAFSKSPAQDFYSAVSPEQSLHSSPQFVPVDDFNGTPDIKHLKAWRWEPVSPSLTPSIDKADGRSAKRGRSLKLHLDLRPGSSQKAIKKFNNIDVSRAERLLFRIKTDIPGLSTKAKISFLIQDEVKSQLVFDLGPQIKGLEDGWKTVALSLSKPGHLNLDDITGLAWNISASKNITGDIWIDEIAFQGKKNVNFKSSEDNILKFPADTWAENKRKQLLKEQDPKKLLRDIAKDTWLYFENARDKKTHLLIDNLKTGEAPLVNGYTSPTNIAMDILAILSAMDLDIISQKQAESKLGALLGTLEKMKRHKGFFYNFYETRNLKVTRQYLSSVDNGWLAIALVVLRQAFPDFQMRASEILDAMNFDEFLDPETNQLLIGLEVPPNENPGPHYGMLFSEARATSLYAIGKGDIPEEHWWFLYRTPPEAWTWQSQHPEGAYVTEGGIEYFQGHYMKGEQQFVPGWGGSLFEYLMPTLVLDEKRWSADSFFRNDQIATRLHIDYALEEKKYPVWGISPCAVPNGRTWRYAELGVKSLGVKGYQDQGYVTPHVSFLALETLPEEALKNIKKLLSYKIYGLWGFYDSLQVMTGRAHSQYLALDQGMILVAIANYLTEGKIRQRFAQDPVGARAARLMMNESFFRD